MDVSGAEAAALRSVRVTEGRRRRGARGSVANGYRACRLGLLVLALLLLLGAPTVEARLGRPAAVDAEVGGCLDGGVAFRRFDINPADSPGSTSIRTLTPTGRHDRVWC